MLVPTHVHLCIQPVSCVETVLLMCYGMASIDLALVQKICFVAESTVVSVQVRLYRSTTYVSRIHVKSSLKLDRFVDKVYNTAVTSLIYFQI